MKTFEEKRLIIIMRDALARELAAARIGSQLGCQIAGIGGKETDVVSLCRERFPDALLIEHPLKVSTDEVISAVSLLPKPVPVIVYASMPCDSAGMMRAGAAACISGNDGLAVFEDAVRVVLSGGRFSDSPSQPLNFATALTSRQHELLRLIVGGLSTREIAARMGLTFKATDHLRTRLMGKLDAHNVVELIRKAVGQGIVELG